MFSKGYFQQSQEEPQAPQTPLLEREATKAFASKALETFDRVKKDYSLFNKLRSENGAFKLVRPEVQSPVLANGIKRSYPPFSTWPTDPVMMEIIKFFHDLPGSPGIIDINWLVFNGDRASRFDAIKPLLDDVVLALKRVSSFNKVYRRAFSSGLPPLVIQAMANTEPYDFTYDILKDLEDSFVPMLRVVQKNMKFIDSGFSLGKRLVEDWS